MANNYKVSGKKMTSKNIFSHSQVRELTKQGNPNFPNEAAAKAEIIYFYGRNKWNQIYRQPARKAKIRMVAEEAAYIEEFAMNY